jgi:hypothetical protein
MSTGCLNLYLRSPRISFDDHSCSASNATSFRLFSRPAAGQRIRDAPNGRDFMSIKMSYSPDRDRRDNTHSNQTIENNLYLGYPTKGIPYQQQPCSSAPCSPSWHALSPRPSSQHPRSKIAKTSVMVTMAAGDATSGRHSPARMEHWIRW